jgi:hypothetical protein
MSTLTYNGTLVVTSCWCGIAHAVPKDLYDDAERNHSVKVYCPLGHSWVFAGETEAVKLKRELAYQRDRCAAISADRDQVQASLRATRGVVTKLRKRTLEGDCPICGQHLRDLARHIGRVHPNERAEGTEE